MKIENPFDEFPGFSVLDLRIDENNKPVPNEFQEWCEKWEPQLWKAYQLMIVLERFCKEKDIGELHFIPRPSTSTARNKI